LGLILAAGLVSELVASSQPVTAAENKAISSKNEHCLICVPLQNSIPWISSCRINARSSAIVQELFGATLRRHRRSLATAVFNTDKRT
jgi:hypothetical protein